MSGGSIPPRGPRQLRKDMKRVIQVKYTAPDGTVYDSREEYLYHQILQADSNVSSIRRQVKLEVTPSIYMRVPKQLKTKIRYDRRLMVAGHSYKPDFIFRQGGRIIVCDVKSKYTSGLREFRITMKAIIRKIMAHNRKRHGGTAVMVFREAIHQRRNEWKIVDYPPEGCTIIDP